MCEGIFYKYLVVWKERKKERADSVEGGTVMITWCDWETGPFLLDEMINESPGKTDL